MSALKLLPIEKDLEVVRATDVTFEFQLTNDVGVPENITGDTMKFTARDTYNGTLKVTKTVTVHQDALNGKTRVTLSKVDLADAGAVATAITTWIYEHRRIIGALEIVWFQGQFRLHPTVVAG